MQTDFQTATHYLQSLDADWAELVKTVGACTITLTPEREPYEALVRTVAYQQLHGKAGDAIIKRFLQIDGIFPTPERLLAIDFDTLRACGFSSRKIDTIKSIAEGALSGVVPNRLIAKSLTEDELIARLTKLKGIGRWTAEMLLIFTLERMDIFPADDFGVVEGYRRLKKLPVAPKRKQMIEIASAWNPYRTIASWYLWRVPK